LNNPRLFLFKYLLLGIGSQVIRVYIHRMKKVILELEDTEYGELSTIIDKYAGATLLAAFAKSVETNNHEAFIKEKVCIAIDKVSILSIAEVIALAEDPKTQSLKFDFRLGSESKRSLRGYFQQILLTLKPESNSKFTNTECEELETFSSCVVLIQSKL